MRLCRGPFDRKEKPGPFYVVAASGALMWIIFLGVSAGVYKSPISMGEMGRILSDISTIQAQKSNGTFPNERQKRQMVRYYVGQWLGPSILFPVNLKDVRILDYYLACPGLDVNLLFQEIFVRQKYFFRAISKNPRIIDCGSHIGMSILYFKTIYPQAEVLGFEPAPATFRFLQANVERNHLDHVVLVNKAVSNMEGILKFYGDDSLRSSLYQERGGSEVVEVEATRLSKYIDRPVDLIKIDVEGAEGLVLDDLAKADKLKMVGQMIIEYHHHLQAGSDELAGFLKILEDNKFGYQIEGDSHPPYRWEFEDIMIYAFQKKYEGN
jgi:FkbM family methyltransferase